MRTPILRASARSRITVAACFALFFFHQQHTRCTGTGERSRRRKPRWMFMSTKRFFAVVWEQSQKQATSARIREWRFSRALEQLNLLIFQEKTP
jgi:hypothetical protein